MIKFKSPIKSQSLQLVKRPFGNSRFKAIYVNLSLPAFEMDSLPQKMPKAQDKNLRAASALFEIPYKKHVATSCIVYLTSLCLGSRLLGFGGKN